GLHLVPGLAVEGRGEMRLDQHHPERLIAPPPTGLYPPSALRGFLKLRLHRRRRFKPVERAHVSPAQQGPKRRGPKERENPAGRAPAPLPLPAPPRGKLIFQEPLAVFRPARRLSRAGPLAATKESLPPRKP